MDATKLDLSTNDVGDGSPRQIVSRRRLLSRLGLGAVGIGFLGGGSAAASDGKNGVSPHGDELHVDGPTAKVAAPNTFSAEQAFKAGATFSELHVGPATHYG